MATEPVDVFALPVHAAAEAFPMLPDDELDELAADIRTNGLRHPLLVKDGWLLDGRNRREACRRAGVVPTTTEVHGIEVEALILSENIARRHLSKSQRAMAAAVLYPETQQGKKKTSLIIKEVNGGYLSLARTVLHASRDTARTVLAGLVSLDVAYKEVKDKQAKDEREAARLVALRASDADIAARVEETDLTLVEGEAIAVERRTDEARDLDVAARILDACEKATGYLVERSHKETRVDSFVRYCDQHPERFKKVDILAATERWRSAIDKLQEALK